MYQRKTTDATVRFKGYSKAKVVTLTVRRIPIADRDKQCDYVASYLLKRYGHFYWFEIDRVGADNGDRPGEGTVTDLLINS